MKRTLLNDLLIWGKKKNRKPILLRGARQVGKTFIIRELGKLFEDYFEINFERDRNVCNIFKDSLSPELILKKLSIFFNKKIIPGRALLFFDEIQECENALKSLRYFYEEIPELHLIAAGSLLEFIIEKIGLPVGRIQNYYLYPMSFVEFLIAKDKLQLVELIKNESIDKFYHKLIMNELYEYLSIGGMPEAVKSWIENEDMREINDIHVSILETYIQDFQKYTRRHQIENVETVFTNVPKVTGRKFVYSRISEKLNIYGVKKALELLCKAMIVHKVYHSSANGIPIEAEAKYKFFKTLFLDIGLMQSLYGENTGEWLINGAEKLISKGQVIEAFIGQEILAYSDSKRKKKLFYWIREKKGAEAEVDYVEQINREIVPIEVKSGKKRYGKSIKIFMEEKKSDSGIVFYNGIPSKNKNLLLYPPYYTIKLFYNPE